MAGLLIALLAAALAWGLPNLGGGGTPVDGGPLEDSPYHIHPFVHITIDGEAALIPTNVGIDPSLWRDHSLDGYGMMASMSPLHTHDTTGKIHVESRVTRDYTLGDFFRVWGESFDGQQVLGHAATGDHAVWMVVDGSEVPPSSTLVLRDGMQIGIVCGVR